MMQLPEFDRHTHSKAFLEAQLAILMGGRVAEEIFTGRITSGAGNDIERATEIARRMVCEFGMSSFGPVAFRRPGPWDEDRGVGYSEATARRVDDEIRDLVMKGYETARQVVARHATPWPRWPRNCWRSSRSTPKACGRSSTAASGWQHRAQQRDLRTVAELVNRHASVASLHTGEPVHPHVDGRARHVFDDGVHQETLAVARRPRSDSARRLRGCGA